MIWKLKEPFSNRYPETIRPNKPMSFIEKEGLRYYQFDLFKNQPLFHAVLTRHGGFSQAPYSSLNTGGTVGDEYEAVLANHQKIYNVLGFDFKSRFDVWQVHGKEVICTGTPRDPETPHQKADGIITDNPDVTLFMRFADCVPILLYDPVKKIIGIVHSGWQGTYKQIARVAVEKMAACYGTRPEDILAGIGPSICQYCYKVGQDAWDAFKKSFGREKASRYFTEQNGILYLDLWKANRETLQSAGVKQIEVSGLCTAEHLDDWYSHRAEHGKTGRFAILMSIVDN
jgi:polyphenol oxidase